MIIKRLYSVWVVLAIAIFFLLFILPLVICASFPRLHFAALRINYWWAWGFFKLAFIPVQQEWRFQPAAKQRYVLCANHFSYLDIPALGLFPLPFKFVGKSQLAKIPLFGYMYKKIHITVNRSSFKSRGTSLQKAITELGHGFNLGFFPEGGIRLKAFPKMVPFQGGAFHVAAENNVPIIPVTFINNYHILPDDQLSSIKRIPCHIIYHAPIQPTGTSDNEIKQLKEEVFRVIQTELNAVHSPSNIVSDHH